MYSHIQFHGEVTSTVPRLCDRCYQGIYGPRHSYSYHTIEIHSLLKLICYTVHTDTVPIRYQAILDRSTNYFAVSSFPV